MKRQWLFGAIALLLAVPVGVVQAQDRDLRVFAFGAGRGRIGVMVDTRADRDRDKMGAGIESVVPDGPAAKAGLEAGDVITKFNGTALAGVKADDEDESGPGMKLVELARKLDPGDKVEIEYRRGTETKKATLEAEDMGNTFSFRMPDMERLQRGMNEFRIMPPGLNFEFFGTGRWGGLELVSLNPDLGEYFAAKEGLLVVSVAEGSELSLKAGDVILSIAGRTPKTPSHAMRILGSYEQGETVELAIMRKQRRQTISMTVPDSPDEPVWRNRSVDPGRMDRPRVRIERS
jgi:S1-C subfamily serine protease